VSVTSQFIGGTINTKGVKIASGQSKTIEIDLFSDGPTNGPWGVDAIDMLAKLIGGAPTMTFAWDKQMGVNGDKLMLTITVTSSTAALFGGAHPFAITSQLGTSGTVWPGLVVEQ
jgi:hypothetical protein